MSNASSTYYSPEVTDALYKYIVYRIRRILYLPQSIWEYQCPPLALEIAQLSSYSFSIWSTFHLGFEQRKRRILKRTSFKVVIPEHVLKDLDAKNESRLVRCPGTFKVHLSLMQWKPDNMFFFLRFAWMTAQKSLRRVCPKFAKRSDVVTKQFLAGSSLDRAAAPCGGKSCSFGLQKGKPILSFMLVELLRDKIYICCMWKWYADILYRLICIFKVDSIDPTVSYSSHFLLGSQLLGRMTWTMKSIVNRQ